MEPSKPRLTSLLNGHAHDEDRHRSSSSASSDSSELSQASPITRKNKLDKLAGMTKQATKRLFIPGRQEQQKRQDLSRLSDPALRVLKEDPAFNPTKLDSKHQSQKSLALKVQTNFQTVAAAILHPKEGAKGKATRSAAGRLSRIERPYISKDMDLEFLEAHDNLSRAKSMASSEQDPQSNNDDFNVRVEELEAQRESLRAAHTLRQHVQRVRVVPRRHVDIPKKEDFVGVNDEGKYVELLKWIGH
ncbi:MAG: hypothetical protein Q9226_005501, partial [Calogaya cf. arnoldii]